MRNRAIAVLFLLCATPLTGQNLATIPAACETLPGNAAVSMPLRWSEGRLQVFLDPPMLPANFVGETITGLRLRRSVLPGDVAYPALTRTIEVRGAFQTFSAAQMLAAWGPGQPTGVQTLFGPASVSVAATAAPGPTTTVGEEFVQLTFSTPLPVSAGTLFLEFASSDGPLTIEPDHWVDAVWQPAGLDDGLAAVVGDGGCTTRSEPTELIYTSQAGPIAGTTVSLEVRGAPPSDPAGQQVGLVLAWAGFDPETTAAGAGYLGYGAPFTPIDPGMVGCHQWAPLQVSWFGVTDAGGRFATTFAIPGVVAVGQRVGVQASWFDPSRPVVPLSLSNGLQFVCSGIGVDDHCSSIFLPGAATTSPWGPQPGLMPVLVLEY